MFDRVLIANRGEIAVRIIQACGELEIEAVAVYSSADEDAKHVRLADEAFHIGPAIARESYLDSDAILASAREAAVDAIHPGYGFLAENETFAAAVEESEFTWIGPTSRNIREFGQKTRARDIMESAGVPVIPGTMEPVTDPDEVADFAADHGYPVAIKAVAGGGGKGLKIVHSGAEIEDRLVEARREGESYFGDSSVYLEKYLGQPRHIEIQVLADQNGTIRHFGERDCTVQRRQQKLIEETPSPVLDEELREQMCKAACEGLRAAEYLNAGTVEFLYEHGEFYFLEVNTRIQVEHPITEMVTGTDLVKWQIRIAAGETFDFEQEDVSFRGHAMEYRINAEDPTEDFAPVPGTVETYHLPTGNGVRVDSGIDEGDRISPYYDSMIAKFVVSASDRDELLRRGRRILGESEIEGVPTTIPFHQAVLETPQFIENRHSTKFTESHVDLS